MVCEDTTVRWLLFLFLFFPTFFNTVFFFFFNTVVSSRINTSNAIKMLIVNQAIAMEINGGWVVVFPLALENVLRMLEVFCLGKFVPPV